MNQLEAANSADYRSITESVVVCFHDLVIARLFSELLETRGVQARVVSDLSGVTSNTQVITEPHFLMGEYGATDGLRRQTRDLSRVLVVCNSSSEANFPHALYRPLTEEKIERALQGLIGRS